MKRCISLIASAVLLAGFLAGCAAEIDLFFGDPPPMAMQTGDAEGSIMDQITPTSAVDELNYYEDEDKMGGGDG